MKKKKTTRTNLTDLSIDLLKDIMLHVAKSSNGAADLASTVAVCRLFRELGEDEVILKAVNFRELKRPLIDRPLWHLSGIAVGAFCAGNCTAYRLAEDFKNELSESLETHNLVLNILRLEAKMKMVAVVIRFTRSRSNDLENILKKYREHIDGFDAEYKRQKEFNEVIKYCLRNWKDKMDKLPDAVKTILQIRSLALS